MVRVQGLTRASWSITGAAQAFKPSAILIHSPFPESALSQKASRQNLVLENNGRNLDSIMARALFRCVRSSSPSLKRAFSQPFCVRETLLRDKPLSPLSIYSSPALVKPPWVSRDLSHGTMHLVISEGKPKFEIHEVHPPRKYKWKTKKRLKLFRKREKEKRKLANKRDPRSLRVKGKKRKHKFVTVEERIQYKLEKAKIKEALLIERLKRYEVPKVQGPMVKPHDLTGEERFYMKKMAQKRSNYVPVGRRGVFGGLILNMHMHWKKHETVKVICKKSCKPGHLDEFVEEIARLSGGIPIQTIGDDTVVFYRGKNYVQPKVMSPIDTLSKKRALEKSKYEQSLESVRHFIAVLEKELELYHRHVALYGDPNNKNTISHLDRPTKDNKLDMLEAEKHLGLSSTLSGIDFTDEDVSETADDSEGDLLSSCESDSEDATSSFDKESKASYTRLQEKIVCLSGSDSEDNLYLFDGESDVQFSGSPEFQTPAPGNQSRD